MGYSMYWCNILFIYIPMYMYIQTHVILCV